MPGGGGGAAPARGLRLPGLRGREGTRLGTRPKSRRASRRHQASATAGTVLAGTELPLARRFLAVRPIATAAEGIASVELGRRPGIERTNARAPKRKLLRAMGRDGWRSPADREKGSRETAG